MKFNTEAIKAWIGAGLTGAADAASHGNGVGGFAVKAIETALSIDIPPQIETWVYSLAGIAIGYVAVYFSSNKAPGASPATIIGIPVSGTK